MNSLVIVESSNLDLTLVLKWRGSLEMRWLDELSVSPAAEVGYLLQPEACMQNNLQAGLLLSQTFHTHLLPSLPEYP
jgi:hypothetical protein